MAHLTLEQRVAALESEIAELKTSKKQNRKKDWRRTIGMFTGDELMRQIHHGAIKYREADRRKTRRYGRKSR